MSGCFFVISPSILSISSPSRSIIFSPCTSINSSNSLSFFNSWTSWNELGSLASTTYKLNKSIAYFQERRHMNVLVQIGASDFTPVEVQLGLESRLLDAERCSLHIVHWPEILHTALTVGHVAWFSVRSSSEHRHREANAARQMYKTGFEHSLPSSLNAPTISFGYDLHLVFQKGLLQSSPSTDYNVKILWARPSLEILCIYNHFWVKIRTGLSPPLWSSISFEISSYMTLCAGKGYSMHRGTAPLHLNTQSPNQQDHGIPSRCSTTLPVFVYILSLILLDLLEALQQNHNFKLKLFPVVSWVNLNSHANMLTIHPALLSLRVPYIWIVYAYEFGTNSIKIFLPCIPTAAGIHGA